MAIVALDTRLAELVDLAAEPEQIGTGYHFTEGPVWNARDQALLFSDLEFGNPSGGTLFRWTEKGGVEVFRSNTSNTNGNTFDSSGRLLSCVTNHKAVERTNADGSIDTLASEYEGQPLNSPNDIVCTPDGDIIFTDPYFPPRDQPVPEPRPQAYVYRISGRDGSLHRIAGDIVAPNGLVVSDDGSTLWVDDSRLKHVRRFDVKDGILSNSSIFCELAYGDSNPLPDGMKLDSRGNLYVAPNTPDQGVWVFSPEGTLLGFIGMNGEGPANLAWGGEDWQTLFVTARTSLYRIRMKVAGQRV